MERTWAITSLTARGTVTASTLFASPGIRRTKHRARQSPYSGRLRSVVALTSTTNAPSSTGVLTRVRAEMRTTAAALTAKAKSATARPISARCFSPLTWRRDQRAVVIKCPGWAHHKYGTVVTCPEMHRKYAPFIELSNFRNSAANIEFLYCHF